ncbi:MAG: hypothetical protein INH41_03835 [Myxococcaceae bacterium]|jgi:hypothetical protein|nr:hypothetical protein [Myxococcaceae bacterium]MCA3011511.1 hypothetical protein [Myxococcaceae bacterium]
MRLEPGAALGDGWQVEHVDADGSVRFTRPASVDRRRALARFVVMAGCFAVTAALVGVSAQSADGLWVLTSSLVVAFGGTGLLALLAGVSDLRRAALGVSLEVRRREGVVRGVLEGAGVVGQFRVTRYEGPLAGVAFTLVPFGEGSADAGALRVTLADGRRLLAPDVPRLEVLRRWLAALAEAR